MLLACEVYALLVASAFLNLTLALKIVLKAHDFVLEIINLGVGTLSQYIQFVIQACNLVVQVLSLSHQVLNQRVQSGVLGLQFFDLDVKIT